MARASAPAMPPAPAEPDLMESLLEDNLPAVGIGGALIALLAGFGVFRLLKRRRNAPAETSFLESRLKPDSFFASGGQRVDTREVSSTGANSSMMNYSLSQLDAIGDVDPVAEADVYLAYGRDLQAEEILKEAMRTTPERLAIRTKLLEVYAKRRDVKGYEQLALQLQAITGGTGDDWAKARELGQQIDPENPLYGGSGARTSSFETRPAYDEQQALSTLPHPMPADSRGGPMSEPPLSSSFDLDLDLDLGMDEAPAQASIPPDTDATVMAPRQSAVPPARPPVAEPPPAAPAPYVPPAEDMLSFSAPSAFGELSPPAAPKAAAPAPASVDPTSFSTSAFSLDLDLPAAPAPAAAMLPPADGFGGAGAPAVDLDPDSDFDTSDPLVRKMELADEFRQIGDLEGARDLLQEVVDRAEGSVKAKAAAMLASLN